ncbi:MAG: DUF3153 domain-containing protein [Hormoscilla sp. SP5CHS1]|nr:DUF3153 domain-containing protein [Hormoscilla sp. SP12CHS1]MBC6453308.1 DUF3153 domain-containing protein [Hormoscilla sp. SP5CHS1]
MIVQRQKLVIRFLVPVYILLLTMLTGCVEYDIGVKMNSQTHGEIVQQIQLKDQLNLFSRATLQTWLDSIAKRVRQLSGKTEMLSDQTLKVIIPFNNGAELAVKFNKFFNPYDHLVSESAHPSRCRAGEREGGRLWKRLANSNNDEADLSLLSANLEVVQNNFILAIRNHLHLDLDLRSLAVVSANDKVLLSPDNFLDLKFSLATPWGAKIIGDDTLVGRSSHQLVWTLEQGKLNHIETIFWVPSPIGIGALIIILLVAGGTYLKEEKVKN